MTSGDEKQIVHANMDSSTTGLLRELIFHLRVHRTASRKGLSPDTAQTLVNIGVDLSAMNTVCDLQGGIEQAERLLGYEVTLLAKDASPDRRANAEI